MLDKMLVGAGPVAKNAKPAGGGAGRAACPLPALDLALGSPALRQHGQDAAVPRRWQASIPRAGTWAVSPHPHLVQDIWMSQPSAEPSHHRSGLQPHPPQNGWKNPPKRAVTVPKATVGTTAPPLSSGAGRDSVKATPGCSFSVEEAVFRGRFH